MSSSASTPQVAVKPPPSHGRHAGWLLQRKCACGAPTASLSGACSECQDGKLLPPLPLNEFASKQLSDGSGHSALQRKPAGIVVAHVGGPILQRQPVDAGVEPTPAEKTPLDDKQESPAQPAESADAGQPQPLCSPTGMTRAKYLQEPGTSTKDFGLTRLDLTSVTYPELATEKVRGGVRVKSTTAALPTIPSVFTGSDTFTEGEAHFIGQDGGECPSKKYPIRWTIYPQGASKIGEGEQEHCADFQHAFDISLKRYGAAVNALAGKTFGSEKKAEQAVVKSVGAAPADWGSIFACLARKTKLRDSHWHTPRPTNREPKLSTNCAYVSAYITGTSLPGVGQHGSAEIIKDCGEAGAASAIKEKAAGKNVAEASKPDLSAATWERWDEDDEAAMPQSRPAPGAQRLQAKLTIGTSNDPLEQEADRVADQVMAMSAHSAVTGAPPRIQRFTEQASGETGLAPASVDQALASAGSPLEPALRQDMELRFNYDFGNVRVHRDGNAAVSARAVNALAYTVGSDVVFGARQYDPASDAGKRLLAHELTHVVQQSGLMGTYMQRQASPQTPASSSDEEKPYILKPPPAIKQGGLTCWAAALSSWLTATGVGDQSVDNIISRYVPTDCTDEFNSLNYETAAEVFAEWGVALRRYDVEKKDNRRARPLTYDAVKFRLKEHGHLLLAQATAGIGHVLVVYGVGVGPDGKPNQGYLSVMDPIDGRHRNLPISGLSYPIQLGYRSGKHEFAPCRNRAKPEPKDEQ